MWRNQNNREERGSEGPVLRDPFAKSGSSGRNREEPYNISNSRRGGRGGRFSNNRNQNHNNNRNFNRNENGNEYQQQQKDNWWNARDEQLQSAFLQPGSEFQNVEEQFPPPLEEERFPAASTMPYFQQQQEQPTPLLEPPRPPPLFQIQEFAFPDQPTAPPSLFSLFQQEQQQQQYMRFTAPSPPPPPPPPIFQQQPQPSSFLTQSHHQALDLLFPQPQPMPIVEPAEPTPLMSLDTTGEIRNNSTAMRGNTASSERFPQKSIPEDEQPWFSRRETEEVTDYGGDYEEETAETRAPFTWELPTDTQISESGSNEQDAPWYSEFVPDRDTRDKTPKWQLKLDELNERMNVKSKPYSRPPPAAPKSRTPEAEIVANPLFNSLSQGFPNATGRSTNNFQRDSQVNRIERNPHPTPSSFITKSQTAVPPLMSFPTTNKTASSFQDRDSSDRFIDSNPFNSQNQRNNRNESQFSWNENHQTHTRFDGNDDPSSNSAFDTHPSFEPSSYGTEWQHQQQRRPVSNRLMDMAQDMADNRSRFNQGRGGGFGRGGNVNFDQGRGGFGRGRGMQQGRGGANGGFGVGGSNAIGNDDEWSGMGGNFPQEKGDGDSDHGMWGNFSQGREGRGLGRGGNMPQGRGGRGLGRGGNMPQGRGGAAVGTLFGRGGMSQGSEFGQGGGDGSMPSERSSGGFGRGGHTTQQRGGRGGRGNMSQGRGGRGGRGLGRGGNLDWGLMEPQASEKLINKDPGTKFVNMTQGEGNATPGRGGGFGNGRGRGTNTAQERGDWNSNRGMNNTRGRGGGGRISRAGQNNRNNGALLPTPKLIPYPPPPPAQPVERNPRGILKPVEKYGNFVGEGCEDYAKDSNPGVVSYDDDDDDDEIEYLGDIAGGGISSGSNDDSHDFFSKKMVEHFSSLLKNKSMEDQLESLMTHVLLAPEFLTTRVNIVRNLHVMLAEKYQKCKVQPYGADFIGIGSSDDSVNVFVDLTGKQGSSPNVVPEDYGVAELTKDMVDELLQYIQTGENHAFFGQIVKRTNYDGRINLPVISFIHSESKVRCNIRLENYYLVQEAKIIQFVSSLDTRISQLLAITRYWSSVHRVLDTPEEDTRNRFISLLVLFFLARKKIIPTMAHFQSMSVKPEYFQNVDISFCDDYTLVPRNENSVLEDKNIFTLSVMALLKEFFKLFGSANFKEEVVSLWKSEFIPKDNFLPHVEMKLLPSDLRKRYRYGADGKLRSRRLDCGSRLCIQDFQDLTENLSLAIPDYDVSKFQLECELAKDRLEDMMASGSGSIMDIFKVTDYSNAT